MARFYVLEGADGAGTTTQARLLAARLAALGRTAHVTQEPSDHAHGKEIRRRLQGESLDERGARELALLFALDRLEHLRLEIEPALARGDDVISDRYVLSSLVYQGLDAPLSWVKELNCFARAPDATVLLSLPLDVALSRVDSRGAGKEVFERRAVQERVHARYRELAADVGALVVDGAAPPEQVTVAIERALVAAGRW